MKFERVRSSVIKNIAFLNIIFIIQFEKYFINSVKTPLTLINRYRSQFSS